MKLFSKAAGGDGGQAAGQLAGRLAAPLAVLAGSLAVWGAAAAAFGSTALPGGQLFALGALLAVAAAAGRGARALSLPELLGQLAAGVLLRSVGFVHFNDDYQRAAALLRKTALAVILIRAGLGLDPAALRRLSLLVLRLAALPSIVEAGTLALAAWLWLGLPWLWGLLAGAVMAAVSPAVVIPALFRLQSRGYGTKKGIPTLVVASASFDDILAVTVFGVTHGVLFAEGRPWDNALHGLLAVPMGLAFGAAWGALARVVPRHSDTHAAPLRSLLVAGGGLLAVLGSDAIGYDGAGPLGAILAAFVACHAWRQQGYTDNNNPVAAHFRSAWSVFQTLLFAFIGAEIDVRALEPRDVGLCAGILLVALGARIMSTVFIAFGAGLTWKEKLFVSFAWLPKATVQAALGPVALDSVRRLDRTDDSQYASYVLTLAVLAILLTAPAGAALLAGLGPRLLERDPASDAHADAPPPAAPDRSGREEVAEGMDGAVSLIPALEVTPPTPTSVTADAGDFKADAGDTKADAGDTKADAGDAEEHSAAETPAKEEGAEVESRTNESGLATTKL